MTYSRHGFALSLLIVLAPFAVLGQQARPAGLTHGPYLGHCDDQSAKVWCRTAEPGEYILIVEGLEGGPLRLKMQSTLENDQCIVWTATGLAADSSYPFSIEFGGRPLGELAAGTICTGPAPDARAIVNLGFGSCAFDAVNPRFDQPVWTRMRQEKLDAIVMLGDTPYIESSELAVQRRRYHEFYALSQLASAFRKIPFYGVWDDHDFGPNDSLGNLLGKEGSRRAFLEFHANPSYGDEDQGVYTRFRRGPVEVFLLDTRWFANTERSPVNPERETLLGRRQWDWLTQSLLNSTADVKILASGMIWNEALYPGKLDAWMAYPYERHGLFKFIHSHKIPGVVLVAGDIHLSRVMKFPVDDVLTYPMYEFISSPLAEHPALYNDIPSPYLKYSEALDNVFLKLSIDSMQVSTTLSAEFHTADHPEPRHRLQLNVSAELAPLSN